MNSIWNSLKFLSSVLLLTAFSCQSVLNGNSEQNLYDDVLSDVMLSDPLLFSTFATDSIISSDFEISMYDAYTADDDWFQAATENLNEALECRKMMSGFNPDLESMIVYLENVQERDSFVLHYYPISTVSGIHLDALTHFSQRPISTKNDVETYLDELLTLEQRFKELIDELEVRRKNGIVAPSSILKSIRLTCDSIVLLPIERNPIYSSYETKLNSIGLLEPSKKEGYILKCKEILLESVIPAYVRLSNYLAQLEETSTNVAGVWRLQNGDLFYAHCLKWHSGLDISPDSIYEVAKLEMKNLETSNAELNSDEDKMALGIQQSSESHEFRKILPTEAHKRGYTLYKKVQAGNISTNKLATAKLIIDLGIHQKRWLKEQAVQYLVSTTGIEESKAERIVSESISTPGAVGAEKIGQLVIQKLRKDNSELSEADFELKITQHGGLPLGVLVKVVSNNAGEN